MTNLEALAHPLRIDRNIKRLRQNIAGQYYTGEIKTLRECILKG